MRLAELLEAIPVLETRGPTDVPVRGVALDSRKVRQGFVFVAVEGAVTDGHRFVDDARRRGAVAVVSERGPSASGVTWIRTERARAAAGRLASRLRGEPSRRLELVGVTGTNGKTTTAYLVEGLVERLAPPAAMMGTVVQRVGARTSRAGHTTPEAPDIQDFLAEAVEAGCRCAVVEVSSHGLALDRLEGSEFAVVVFTNLSRDHLDFHGDMERYFAAKRLLFDRYRRAGAPAIVGVLDEYGRRLAAETAPPVVTFGYGPEAAIRAMAVESSFEGLRVRFWDGTMTRRIESPLVGRHNVPNLLAAYAVGRRLGFAAERIVEALGDIGAPPGRYERVDDGGPFRVIVDYAHTDAALRNLLATTRELPHRRILTVFGCGGDRDASKRPLMGAVAARLSDVVVLTSDNPRNEDPMAILEQILAGTKTAGPETEIVVEPDRRKAIEIALDRAEPDDVVVVAGRGHEPYQIVRGEAIPFDDREVIREILAARGAPVRRPGR